MLHFSISGESITNFIRERCLDGCPRHAFDVFSTLIPEEGHGLDLLKVFRDLITGAQTFDGVNELFLKEGSGKNITEDILHVFRRSIRDQVDERDVNEDDEFDAKAYNLQVEKDEAKRKLEFNFFLEKMGLSLTQVEDLYLKSRHSEDFSHPHGGWVTPQGYFIPVPSMSHEEVFFDLRDKGYTFAQTVTEVEQKWVRISSDTIASFMKDMSITSRIGQHYQMNFSARQKLTLEKIIIARNLLKEGEIMDVYGFGQVVMENGRCKFFRSR